MPIGFLAGAARSLFVPLALAVVLAMLMVDRAFDRFRAGYGRCLAWALERRGFVEPGTIVEVAPPRPGAAGAGAGAAGLRP